MAAFWQRLYGDVRVLWSLARGQPKSGDHASNLAAFYGPQAEQYDQFRERLLAGRRELLEALASRLPNGARIVELGCGTGRNVAFLGATVNSCRELILVDLCQPLLDVAANRFQQCPQIRCIHGDATRFQPESGPVDAVYFSYALTMIPDWQAALENARIMLKPDGILAVVDFYVSSATPIAGRSHHGPWTRWFWPKWFAHDGVHLNPAHLDWLNAHFETIELTETRNPVPYLFGLTVPYYRYLGRPKQRAS